MPLIPFSSLPSSARLWIFAAEKPIDPSKLPMFNQELDTFLDVWQAHGKALAAGHELRYGQFLFVAVDENLELPSGCSIDTLTREVTRIGKEFGVDFLSSALISYREGKEIITLDRPAFKSLVESGKVTSEAIVFNNTLTAITDVREGKWEVPAYESWHGRAFKFPVTA